MKCKYCGGNLTLEAEFCPYCGKVNEQAQKHVRAMKGYQSAFEKTRQGVYESTNQYTAGTVRVVIIAVLFVAIIVLLILGGKAYDFRRMWIQGKTERNSDQYMAVMDGYLEEENFIAFGAFCNENYIYAYDSVYEKYAPVERATQNYTYVYNDIMRVVSPPEYQEMEQILETLVESLDYFYSCLDMEQYEYYEGVDTPKNRDALAAMEEKVERMLQNYCGLTAEQTQEFSGLTKARRAVLLEEAVMRMKEAEASAENGNRSEEAEVPENGEASEEAEMSGNGKASEEAADDEA